MLLATREGGTDNREQYWASEIGIMHAHTASGHRHAATSTKADLGSLSFTHNTQRVLHRPGGFPSLHPGDSGCDMILDPESVLG